MKKSYSAILGAVALIAALAAGYFFGQSDAVKGILCAAVAGVTLLVMLLLYSRSTRQLQEMPPDSLRVERIAGDIPSINLAFCGGLSRLIDEGKDTGAYLRYCHAPYNMIKSVNIGGATQWYYHKDETDYNEFRAEYPIGEAKKISHPYITKQEIIKSDTADIHIITVDLYHTLIDWGEKHPEKKKYANSMRLALHGGYTTDNGAEDGSILDKTIEEVRAERKAYKKDMKNKKKQDKRSL